MKTFGEKTNKQKKPRSQLLRQFTIYHAEKKKTKSCKNNWSIRIKNYNLRNGSILYWCLTDPQIYKHSLYEKV